jgi:hypothetical protein
MTAVQITDESGYITDRAVRKAYERICDAPAWPRCKHEQVRSAEAFLKLVERYAARGIRLICCEAAMRHQRQHSRGMGATQC